MWYINIVCFFPTKMMGIIKIHFGHYVGKYDPLYWITPYILCRDRPAAARRCAYLFLFWFWYPNQTINIFLVFFFPTIDKMSPNHLYIYISGVSKQRVKVILRWVIGTLWKIMVPLDWVQKTKISSYLLCS